MTIEPIGELHELLTADGNKLVLPGGDKAFLAYGGYGAPPIQYITRRGYRQHGQTEVDYQLDARSFSVQLWQQNACSRQEYWDNRYALQEFLRPNRGGQIQFTLRQPDGSLRSLMVRANPGLIFNAPSDNSWGINEPLEFTAFDPIWFDPSIVSLSVVSEISSHLVFPITFPIQFGTSGLQFNQAIVYAGSWRTYPTITITGPYQSATLRHAEQDVLITLNVAILAGQSRILDLTPGQQRITDGAGVNHFGDLGPLSNLIDFCLLPDPELSGGVNSIEIILNRGIAGQSSVTLAYQTRYFAL